MLLPDKSKPAYLPPCVLKEELAGWFGVSLDWMWSDIITSELLEEWGYEISSIKRKHRLSFHLTRRIYLHFGIRDLLRPYSDYIREELDKVALSKVG